MSNILYQPYMNPIKFHELNPTLIPQYISKHMDDWMFEKTIQPWEQPVVFRQLWGKEDAIRLQYESNYQPITLKLFKCNGEEVYSQNMQVLQENFFRPGFFIKQSDLDLSAFEEGYYYLTITSEGTELSLISEPFEILEDVPETLYIEFQNNETFGGIRFSSPFFPAIRIPAWLKYTDTASKDTIYEDDPLNQELLKSIPYRVWTLFVGGHKGIPAWLADKIKRIFCCSDIRIDGRYFTKTEGGKWESFENDGYPMSGWKIDLRERYNRDSLIYENDVEIIGVAAAGLIVDTKGFGMNDDTGDDYLEIESLI